DIVLIQLVVFDQLDNSTMFHPLAADVMGKKLAQVGVPCQGGNTACAGTFHRFAQRLEIGIGVMDSGHMVVENCVQAQTVGMAIGPACTLIVDFLHSPTSFLLFFAKRRRYSNLMLYD